MKRARNVAQRAAEARRIQDAIRRGVDNEGLRPGIAKRLGLVDMPRALPEGGEDHPTDDCGGAPACDVCWAMAVNPECP